MADYKTFLPVVVFVAVLAPAVRAQQTESWPALPAKDGAVELPAQEWPLRPGDRKVRVLVHYPDGTLPSVNKNTGIMLTLHNRSEERRVGKEARSRRPP